MYRTTTEDRKSISCQTQHENRKYKLEGTKPEDPSRDRDSLSSAPIGAKHGFELR